MQLPGAYGRGELHSMCKHGIWRCAGCSCSGRSVKTSAIGRRAVAARAFVTLVDSAGVCLARPLAG